MRTLILIIAMTLLPINFVKAWSKADTGREILYQGLHLIDYSQTLTIAKNPDRYFERNSILGRHPSVGSVNSYMGAASLVHLGISIAVPKKYRALWQWTSAIATTYVIGGNFRIGIKVGF